MTRATPTNRQASSSVASDNTRHFDGYRELRHSSSPHDNDDADVDLDPPSTQTKGGKLDTPTTNAKGYEEFLALLASPSNQEDASSVTPSPISSSASMDTLSIAEATEP